MEVRQCLKCKAVNAPDTWDCYACGCTLGVNSIRNRDDIRQDFIQLIKRYQDALDEDSRLEAILELARRFKYEAEAARFLGWISENDQAPRVAKTARYEVTSWTKSGSGNGRKGRRLFLFRLMKRQVDKGQVDDPALITYTKACLYAAVMTLTSRILDAIARILLDVSVDEISALGLGCAFLAIGLLYAYPWARESLLVSTALVAILSGIVPLSQGEALPAFWLSLINLGYAIPTFLILVGEPTDTKNKFGWGIFIGFSLVPTVLLLLTAVF